MKEKRDIKIHRSDTPLNKHSHRTIQETIIIKACFGIIARDKEGNIKDNMIIPQQHANSAGEKNVNREDGPIGGVKWFFEDDPTTELIDKCKQLLKEIESFVSKIESTFP